MEPQLPIASSVFPQGELSRRAVMATSLAAGFALAVQPVTAQTIVNTDTDGLDAGEVQIPTRDGVIPGYRAQPKSGGPFPIVLVIQEIFGVHEHIKDVCRRFAKLGYLAIAPELYARQGDVSALTDTAEIFKIVRRVPDSQVLADLDAAADWAQRTGQGDINRLGITGFCWGGRVVWLYATHSTRLKAGVAWYGRLDGDRTEFTPQHPVDIAAQIKAPVLGLYAGQDQGIPLSQVEQMREGLKQAAVEADIIVYPQAQHGFHADYRPMFKADDARDGWARLQQWFRKHGVM